MTVGVKAIPSVFAIIAARRWANDARKGGGLIELPLKGRQRNNAGARFFFDMRFCAVAPAAREAGCRENVDFRGDETIGQNCLAGFRNEIDADGAAQDMKKRVAGIARLKDARAPGERDGSAPWRHSGAGWFFGGSLIR